MDCNKLKEKCDCEHCKNIEAQIKRNENEKNTWFKGSRNRDLR